MIRYFDPTWIANLLVDAGAAANPFPGRFPTRWYISVLHYFDPEKPAKLMMQYNGKPNTVVWDKFRKLMLTGKYSVRFIEYDKGSKLRSVTNQRANSFSTDRMNSTLLYRYYPSADYMSFQGVSNGFRAETVAFRTKRLGVYKPRLPLTATQLREWRQWMFQHMPEGR